MDRLILIDCRRDMVEPGQSQNRRQDRDRPDGAAPVVLNSQLTILN
jgi:hypothetical protein